jgi:hypothetical protein
MLFLVLFVRRLSSRLQRQCMTRIVRTQVECARVIAGKSPTGTANALNALEARAKANARLVYTFGIDNAFTTVQSRRHCQFRTQVTTLLTPDWVVISKAATDQAGQIYPGHLVSLVQSFVLKMIVHILFGRDLAALDNENVSFVAAEINRLWSESKVPHGAMAWAKHGKMHRALYQLLPDCDPLNPQETALNLILPAFETMWRVVFRCFIEVRYRGAEERLGWTEALRVYLVDPCSQSDDACSGNRNVAVVRAIVCEILRLYPPTRHIHRHIECTGDLPTRATADIEGLHRDKGIWGEDASRFKPSRWTNASLDPTKLKEWMPFGGSPFLCPAKPDFGPRLISILVAALVVEFYDEKYELLKEHPRGQKDIARFDGPLRSERDSYQDLFLELNAPCA